MKNPILWIVVAILVIFGFLGCGQYNGMVDADNTVEQTWGDVQSSYQRRADLIPNLVATVKGAANFEKETYIQVALARSGQLKQAVAVPVDSLNPQKLQQIQQLGNQVLEEVRSAINITIERYPDLKATINFSDLQRQLEGTENRINTERGRYNEAVAIYNGKVRRFPGNLFAGIFGFERRSMFEAEEGADKAPDVNF